MTGPEELKKNDRAFLEDLASLNGLTAEQALDRLLNPVVTEPGAPGSGRWRPAAVEDGRFTDLHLGTGPKFPDRPVDGFPELEKVPSFEKLTGLKRFYIHRKCSLTSETLDLSNCQDLEELKIHGQETLKRLRTGKGVKTLSLLGNASLEEADITPSPGLEQFGLNENKCLRNGVVCTDLQTAALTELRKSKTLVDPERRTAASAEELDVLLQWGPDRIWEDKFLLKALTAHENLTLAQALALYWQKTPALYGKYGAMSQCETTMEKEQFRAAALIEKRIKAESLGNMDQPAAPPAEGDVFDVSGLKKKIPDAVFSLSGIRPEGSTVKSGGAKKAPAKKSVKNDDWAIREMTEWLSHPMEYGRPPEEVSVYYRKKLPWFGSPEEKVFLMSWTMDNGDSFIGFTGPTTWSFAGIPMAEVKGMYKKTHKLDLINLYAGWHLAWMLSEDNPSCRKPDPGLQEKTLKGLEEQGWTDLQYSTYIKVGENEHFVYSGRKREKDFHIHVKYEKGGLQPMGNRSIEKSTPVNGRIPLFFWLGVYYGPIRWGH